MILTTRQLSAATKAGRIEEMYQKPEGDVLCSKCGKHLGSTASPRFWQKGDTVTCPKCGPVLAQPHYPGGLVLDLSR